MTRSLPFDYFPITGSGSVSQFKTGISTANLGGNFNHNNNTIKAALRYAKGRGLYPITFGQLDYQKKQNHANG